MSQPAEADDLNNFNKPRRWIYLLPLAVLGVLMIIFFIGLGLNPQLLPSPLIGKAAPAFNLPRLDNPEQMIAQTELSGEPSLLNIWATWCPSCKTEHPVLLQIAKSNEVPIYGLFYKDDPEKGQLWLEQYGNPYQANAVDLDGRVGIEWGAYGTPETFVIDADGIIRYKHVGPIDWQDWQNTLLPMIKSLRKDSGV